MHHCMVGYQGKEAEDPSRLILFQPLPYNGVSLQACLACAGVIDHARKTLWPRPKRRSRAHPQGVSSLNNLSWNKI